MKSLFAICALVFGLAVTASAQQNNSMQNMAAQNMPTGKAFITKAAQINLTEIELGKLAEQKGHNKAVQEFGTRMVKDHGNAENSLKQLAQKDDVTLPGSAGMDAANLKQRLSGESGAQFDQMYIEHMLGGHKQAIAIFENEIEHGQNSSIKSYAEKCLPVIQDHIRIAEDVAGKMDLSGKTGLEAPGKAITTNAMSK